MLAADLPLAPFVRELSRYGPLQSDDVRALTDLPTHLRTLDPGSYLIREGDPPKSCCVLVDGFVVRQKVTSAGARQIIAICIPGDAIDFQNLFLSLSDHAVMALTKVRIADISREALQRLVLKCPQIAEAIIKSTLVDASILREWVLNVGRRDARARIAHLLCEFAVRLEARGLAGRDGFELPMTQEQIADASSLTPVHVNRVLKGLERDELIHRFRRHIGFPDWRRLQDVADFSRNYLHMAAEDQMAYAH